MGVSVGVGVGVDDVGAPGLGGGVAGVGEPGWSLITRPMVVPLPLLPTVWPLAHSNPVMTAMASRKAPSDPTITAPQRSATNRLER